MNKSKRELFDTIKVIFYNFYNNTLNNVFLSKYIYKISKNIYFAKLWWFKIECVPEDFKCLIFNHFTLVCKKNAPCAKKTHPCAKKMHPPFWGIQKVLNNKNNLLVKVKFMKK